MSRTNNQGNNQQYGLRINNHNQSDQQEDDVSNREEDARSGRAKTARGRAILEAEETVAESSRVVRNIDSLLDNFDRGLGKLFPKAFNAVEFGVQSDRHLDKYDIRDKFRVTNNNKITIGRAADIVVNNCATLNNNFFFYDERRKTYFSVRNQEMRTEALRLGYKEIYLSHFMEMNDIPQPLVVVTPDRPDYDPFTAPVGTENEPEYPPFDEVPHKKIPQIFKKDRAEKYAAAIVRAWEDRFIYDGRAYSPIKWWDEKEVRARGCTEPLTRLGKPYCAVYYLNNPHALNPENTVPIADISMAVGDLNKWATANLKNRTNAEGKVEWFDFAQSLAKWMRRYDYDYS
jgi:hypothetical protein